MNKLKDFTKDFDYDDAGVWYKNENVINQILFAVCVALRFEGSRVPFLKDSG